MKVGHRLMTREEEKAVVLLIYEYIQLKERNASDQELMEWRAKVKEKFPNSKEQMLDTIAQSLSNNMMR